MSSSLPVLESDGALLAGKAIRAAIFFSLALNDTSTQSVEGWLQEVILYSNNERCLAATGS